MTTSALLAQAVLTASAPTSAPNLLDTPSPALVPPVSTGGEDSRATPNTDRASIAVLPLQKLPTPVTEYLTEFQALLGKQLRSLRLTDPAMGHALANYASLLTVATVERIHDACFHNANNPKLPALIRELNKAQSNLDRANARAKREQFLKEKELRRIQRDQERKERDKQRMQHQRERDHAKIKSEELKLQRAKIESQTKADERAQRKAAKAGKAPQ